VALTLTLMRVAVLARPGARPGALALAVGVAPIRRGARPCVAGLVAVVGLWDQGEGAGGGDLGPDVAWWRWR
jgi:hypothetical protein